MKTTDNTILITGGGSGIGRALAEAFHQLGNRVIIAGRRQGVLDEVTAANPGMHSAQLDIESASSIQSFAEQIKRDHPSLNVVIHNAGIMRTEMVASGALTDAEATVATNLLGPIRLTAALLPFPEDAGMGWGLDVHWSAVCAARRWRIGVVDATPIAHTLRVPATGYGREEAIAGARRFLEDRPYTPRAQVRTLSAHRFGDGG